MPRIILALCLTILSQYPQSVSAQEEPRSSSFVSVGTHYAIDFPLGNLADRYGQNYHAGLSLRYFSIKMKGFIAIEGNAQFGTKVKEDGLADYRLESGVLLGNNGSAGELFLRRRGVYLGLSMNKIIFSEKDNPLSGLALGIGAGIWQHNIRFIDERSSVSLLSGDYKKGYDRATRGPALKQTISYEHIGLNKSINYSVGLSVMQGFTKSIRAVNFDTGLRPDEQRLDLAISLEAIWYLPIKALDKSTDEIFY